MYIGSRLDGCHWSGVEFKCGGIKGSKGFQLNFLRLSGFEEVVGKGQTHGKTDGRRAIVYCPNTSVGLVYNTPVRPRQL